MTKTWIAERLKNAIKAEYDTKLESHKAQLKAEYDKQLETHKAQLKARSDVEIEQLKSSLNMAASQRNTTFSQLHTRRVDVIANTYAKLKKLHDCVANYVKPLELTGERSKEERRNEVVEASEEFKPYYSQNQIFLSHTVADAIGQVNQELISLSNLFIYTVDLPQTPNVDNWVKITEKFNGSVTEALRGLEKQLRQLLGDDV
ncbi:MAG: hypothetical protein ACXU8N_10025 [Telluria sp.]